MLSEEWRGSNCFFKRRGKQKIANSEVISPSVQEERWERYMYEWHTPEELAGWAKQLRVFRYCRAYGGHANDGDALKAAILINNRHDLEEVCSHMGMELKVLPALHDGDPPYSRSIQAYPEYEQPGWIEISEVPLHVWVYPDRLELHLADPINRHVVTQEVLNAAVIVEQILEPLYERIIDPPQDNRRCVCPKYYPALFK